MASRALLMALAFSVASTLSTAPILASGGGEGRLELVEGREVYAKVFDNLDGTLTVHTAVEPLHYKPPGGELFLDIDPTLTAEDGWSNTTNSFPVLLPPELGGGSAIDLGQDRGFRWRPGALYARLLSGAEVAVAHPEPVWGAPSEEVPNTIVYPNLYPGMDLEVRVRRGSLELTMAIRSWLLPFSPEQVDFLFVEAETEVDPALLEAVFERVGQGEPLEAVPLYLGRAEDEWVIEVAGHPGIQEPQLEEHADALTKDEHGVSGIAPPHWRSQLFSVVGEGRLHHFFRVPAPDGTESVPRALTASFELASRAWVEQRTYFGASSVLSAVGSSDPASFKGAVAVIGRETQNGVQAQQLNNRIIAAKGENGLFYRTVLVFQTSKSMIGAWSAILANPAASISRMSLGLGSTVGLPPGGVLSIDWDSIIAYRGLPFAAPDKGFGAFFAPLSFVLDGPYNQELRPLPGGNLKVATWSYQATTPPRFETVAGQDLLFGDLGNAAPGAAQPTALTDFKASVDQGIPFMVVLAQPYDRTTCQQCTANHFNPAVQALNGDYRVGAELYDVRLEVTLATTVDQLAQLGVTSVGGHDDRLFPGETLAWDLQLDSYTGPPDSLELSEVPWPKTHYDVWFSDPASGTVVDPPRLSNIGDTVRLNLRSKQADPQLYGQIRTLSVRGTFVGTQGSAEKLVRIPVRFEPPEAVQFYTQLASGFDRGQTTPQVLARLSLPVQGLRGTAFAVTGFRMLSGPRTQVYEGTHWSRTVAVPGSGPVSTGEVRIHPWELPAGSYSVEVTPCIHPDGFWVEAHCLPALARQMPFVVTETPLPVPKPVIDFVAPWSIDSPSAGTVTVSIFGQDLGGGAVGTSVTIPQVVSGASPASGSTASRVDLPVSAAVGTACGPRPLSLVTAGGTDQTIFNLTRPFQGAPHHFAVEAEAGNLNGTARIGTSAASGGEAVTVATPGAPGALTLRFRVPATSSSYQLYALYSTPEANAARADITLSAGGTSLYFYKIALSQTAPGAFKLGTLFDSTQAGPPTLLSLQAGTTYELKIEARPGQRFPILDLLVLTDGALPPTLAELCR